MEKPRLISFKLCPYVQRSVITLLEKKVDFKLEFIDIHNKPDWFLKLSPLGRVPILETNKGILFESAVINEYLDEIYQPSLHPSDPFLKAENRSWIEFSSGLLVDQYNVSLTKDKEEFTKLKSTIQEKLLRLEAKLPNSSKSSLFFNGDKFSLIDAGSAPLLQRFRFLENASQERFLTTPKILQWTETLLAKESVQKSILPEVEKEYIEYIITANSYFASNILGV
jgi:glutathione S-transferase